MAEEKGAPQGNGEETPLEAARRRAEARDAEALKAAEALELERLLLVEKFLAEGKEEHVEFEVVTTRIGNFVVVRPDFIVAKRFTDHKGDKGVEDVIKFVLPSIVVPNRGELGTTFQDHAGIAFTLSLALLKMFEAQADERAGK